MAANRCGLAAIIDNAASTAFANCIAACGFRSAYQSKDSSKSWCAAGRKSTGSIRLPRSRAAQGVRSNLFPRRRCNRAGIVFRRPPLNCIAPRVRKWRRGIGGQRIPKGLDQLDSVGGRQKTCIGKQCLITEHGESSTVHYKASSNISSIRLPRATGSAGAFH